MTFLPAARLGALAAVLIGASGLADQPRPTPALALDLIAAFEGLETAPYTDPAGNCMIGYGHRIASTPCADAPLGGFGAGVSEEAARTLLVEDAAAAGRIVETLAPAPLTDGQYGALVSFVFNLGEGRAAGSTLLARVRAGDHAAAAAEFARWVMARDPKTGEMRPLPGLVARRACEAALYRGDLAAPFDAAACGG